MSFQRIGQEKAATDIEQHESISISDAVTKAYSFKIPTYLMEMIDASANHMGISRNQLVNQMLINYLPQAFSEFTDGYSSLFVNKDKSEAQILLDELEKALDKTPVSDEAKSYFQSEIMSFIRQHDMTGDKEK